MVPAAISKFIIPFRFRTLQNSVTLMAKQWGDWIEHEELGGGGQGVTYLVRKKDCDTGELRVLKVRGSNGPFKNKSARFKNEFAAGNLLKHPNLIRVFEAQIDCDKPYIVSEYCERGTLSDQELYKLTLLERLCLFKAICDGVAFAHANQVIHRDLKPDNIFVKTDGTPVVGDFGLCFFADSAETRATNRDEVVGARHYMAPECEDGQQDDVAPSADVYSLGKVLYWMLACKMFSGEKLDAPQYNLLTDERDVEMGWTYHLLRSMIAEFPSSRPQDAGELSKELEELIRRIEQRRRMLELSRAPTSLTGREVRVTSFRTGSLPQWRSVETSGVTDVGFAVSGNRVALWGTATTESGSRFFLRTGDLKETLELKIIDLSPPQSPQRGCYHAISADDSGITLLAMTQAENPDFCDAYTLRLSAAGNVETQGCATRVGHPRTLAVSRSSQRKIAAYFGVWNGQPMGQTVINDSDSAESRIISEHTNFQAPLAFDSDGTLHQAIVCSYPAGKHELRRLLYLSKKPQESWTTEVMEEVQNRGVYEQFEVVDTLSANISLAIGPENKPVILMCSSDRHRLVVLIKEQTETKRHEINVPFGELGTTSTDTTGVKQIYFDRHGLAHIVLMALSDLVYLLLDFEWNVLESRCFPANQFLGMGVDHRGDVHIATL